jgi:hypothetical protein
MYEHRKESKICSSIKSLDQGLSSADDSALKEIFGDTTTVWKRMATVI